MIPDYGMGPANAFTQVERQNGNGWKSPSEVLNGNGDSLSVKQRVNKFFIWHRTTIACFIRCTGA